MHSKKLGGIPFVIATMISGQVGMWVKSHEFECWWQILEGIFHIVFSVKGRK